MKKVDSYVLNFLLIKIKKKKILLKKKKKKKKKNINRNVDWKWEKKWV
jgi:hypothetical protein